MQKLSTVYWYSNPYVLEATGLDFFIKIFIDISFIQTGSPCARHLSLLNSFNGKYFSATAPLVIFHQKKSKKNIRFRSRSFFPIPNFAHEMQKCLQKRWCPAHYMCRLLSRLGMQRYWVRIVLLIFTLTNFKILVKIFEFTEPENVSKKIVFWRVHFLPKFIRFAT